MEEEEEEHEAEVEAAGPSDSCLTQDEESSCDTMGPQPNGHHPHAPFTEEESSNEPPVSAPAGTSGASELSKEPTPKEKEVLPAKEGYSEKREKHTHVHYLGDSSYLQADGHCQAKQADFQPLIKMPKSLDDEVQPQHLVSQVDCVNGNESMDSLDSQSLKRNSEAEKRTCQGPAGDSDKPEQEEHNDEHENHPIQERPVQDGRGVIQGAEEEQGEEGMNLNYTSYLKYKGMVYLCVLYVLMPCELNC